MFNAVSSLFRWAELSDSEKTQVKKNLFSLTDEKIRDKIAFGFFLDRFKPETALQENQFGKLDHLNFMAGSLTSQEFVALLQEFLFTKEAKEHLSPMTMRLLQEYTATLLASQAQGELVDLLRSSDFRLILNAATGGEFWAVEETSLTSHKDAERMQAKMVSEIQKMNVGEKRLFLLGSILHETRLEVRKVGDHFFELIYFDTARKNRAQIHPIEEKRAPRSGFFEASLRNEAGFG